MVEIASDGKMEADPALKAPEYATKEEFISCVRDSGTVSYTHLDVYKRQGLNSANGEWGNMIDMGVLDPVKVTRTTLQNAASVASLILITEATVSDVPKNTQLEDAIAAATANAQGGGMY